MSTPLAMTGRDHIFISYRRDDARGASGRLYDWLRIGFGQERVFRDVHDIGVGRWRDKIDAALARSSVCVAVIGLRWAHPDNLARLHKAEGDMVRHELQVALADEQVIVVPTLIEGAKVPDTAALPDALRPLFEVWNARAVTEDGWEDDMHRLLGEIAAAAQLPLGPDLAALLRDAGAAQQRMSELEQERHLQAGQIEALRGTIDELTRKLAEASSTERQGLAEAFAALGRGDSLAAEEAFEREYEAQGRVEEAARRTGAEAARNVANLALLRDLGKAVVFYRKAAELDKDHIWTALLLGGALVLTGDLVGARRAYANALDAAVAQENASGEIWAQNGLGDVAVMLGSLEEARKAYTSAMRRTEQCLAAEPNSTEWQRDLSVSHNRVGDVLVTQGDGPGALVAYRKCLSIAEGLAARDMANTEWQRDLSVSQDRVGDVLVAQGDGPGALIAYRKGLAIHEGLAARDMANTEWQRDLSVSQDRVGDVLVTQGDGPGALIAYRKGLVIREGLAARDMANTEWQRDLSVSQDRVGDVLVAQGDGPGALIAYRKGLAIHEGLAARDMANTEWQRDLSVSQDRVGDVLVAQGDGPGALIAYRKGLAIHEGLAARDMANTEWQRDLSVSQDRVGDVLVAQGDGPGALIAYRKGLAIHEGLAARDMANTEWQRDLSVSQDRVGDVLVAQGDGPGALIAYRKGLAIAEGLAARDTANTEWQRDLAVSCAKLGTLEDGESRQGRRGYLLRGRKILLDLQQTGRLMPSHDWIWWFDEKLAGLAE